jgi:hypothetical protein
MSMQTENKMFYLNRSKSKNKTGWSNMKGKTWSLKLIVRIRPMRNKWLRLVWWRRCIRRTFWDKLANAIVQWDAIFKKLCMKKERRNWLSWNTRGAFKLKKTTTLRCLALGSKLSTDTEKRTWGVHCRVVTAHF